MSQNTIRLEGPVGTGMGQVMSEIRAWLDCQKIQPVSFKSITTDSGVEFHIGFHHPEEADRFREQFMPPGTID